MLFGRYFCRLTVVISFAAVSGCYQPQPAHVEMTAGSSHSQTVTINGQKTDMHYH